MSFLIIKRPIYEKEARRKINPIKNKYPSR